MSTSSYEEARANHRWQVPDRYNIAADVCDRHPRDKLAMIHEDFDGTVRRFAQNQCRLILGRALDVLPRLSDGAYDMVFCDADVRDYPDYLTAALRLLRPGGVVAFNNALTAGAFADDPDEVVDLAQQVRSDDRLVPVLVPLGNGLLAAVKRGD